MKSLKNFEFKNGLIGLELDDLDDLATNIRAFLIDSVSKTGGHIGANLGVIELTIALHVVFDVKKDFFLFDTGHQGYTHKILTGRLDEFKNLNKFRGMSRFLSRNESELDHIEASHAGTALSIAAGLEKTILTADNKVRVITIIGDGSICEGMSLEALLFLGASESKIIIIINDNEMAIAPTVGSLGSMFSKDSWEEESNKFFSSLGFSYIAVKDGHSIKSLIKAFTFTAENSGPSIIHVKTIKGKGLKLAKSHPYKMHFSQPFDPDTGEGVSATISGTTMGAVAADAIDKTIKADPNVFVVTPATPYASYLEDVISKNPDRVIDVGMAEQHAIGFSVGLALGGKRPILCIQSTFLQRGYDQLIHDLAFMQVPMTVIAIRTGLAGLDSPTHHGIFDLSFFRTIPNFNVFSPVTYHEIPTLIQNATKNSQSNLLILPYEPVCNLALEFASKKTFEIINQGSEGLIMTLIGTLDLALKIKDAIKLDYNKDYKLIVLRQIKPFDSKSIENIHDSLPIIVIEEYLLSGGLGSLILETLSDLSKSNPVFRMGIDDIFPPAGQNQEIRQEIGLTLSQFRHKYRKFLARNNFSREVK